MNTRKTLYKFAIITAVAAGAVGAVVACSGDDSNGNPSPDSGGASGSSSGSSSSGSSTSGSSSSGSSSSGSSSSGSSTSGSSTSGSSSGANDGGPNCTPDGGSDFYNACSSYVTGCIPFDKTRVPTHPQL